MRTAVFEIWGQTYILTDIQTLIAIRHTPPDGKVIYLATPAV